MSQGRLKASGSYDVIYYVPKAILGLKDTVRELVPLEVRK